jgi:glycosyltransferase involved in cell wall biosynthesis
MYITIVGFESWAPNTNIFNIGKQALKTGVLHKLICPACKAISVPEKDFMIQEPLSLRGLSFLLVKINYLIEDFPHRYYNEQLFFDMFARKHINRGADAVLHTDSGLVMSLMKAKSLGIPTIILHRTLHPLHVANILKEESKKFGIMEKSVLVHEKWVRNRVKTLKECDKIFALSELERDSLVKYGIPDSKIEVLHYGQGVDTDYFRPSSKKEETFTVLFLGHKSLIKGVPYLLEAWRRLNLKDAKLVIAGFQDKRLIEMYRRRTQFEAPGIVNPLKYYQEAHIYILPSLGDPFPRTALEAMSCGLPVIVSDMTGIKDIIEDGKEGFIIPSRSVKYISEKILYFYENPSEIKRMGKNARSKAEEYTWENFAKEVIEKVQYWGSLK